MTEPGFARKVQLPPASSTPPPAPPPASGEQIDESSVYSDKSPLDAVQWTGTSMAEVLRFAGHRNSSINSFGDPCVKVGEQLEPVEIGQWVFRDIDGGMHICTTEVLGFIQALIGIAESEGRLEGLESRIAKVRELCDEADASEFPEVRGDMRSEIVRAVLDGEGEKP